jgi:hypothetical protein
MRSSTNNYAAARTALLIEDPCTYRKNCQQGALPKPLDGCALCHHSRNEAYYLDLGLVDPLPVWALDVEIRRRCPLSESAEFIPFAEETRGSPGGVRQGNTVPGGARFAPPASASMGSSTAEAREPSRSARRQLQIDLQAVRPQSSHIPRALPGPLAR